MSNRNQSASPFIRHTFNLVEIVLALVVIAVGVVAVMGLFPVGNTKMKTAVADINVADAGDQFLRLFSSKLKINWGLSNVLPVDLPNLDDSNVSFSNSDSNAIWTSVAGVNVYYYDMNNNGSFDWQYDDSLPRDDSGLFKLVQATDTNISDFDCVVRVWRTAASYRSYDSSTGVWTTKAVPPTNGCTLNAEFSFPSSLPYASRTKRTFRMDVFRPIENPATDFVILGVDDGTTPVDPPAHGVGGIININPNNSPQNEFTLTLADGSTITRDDLHSGAVSGYEGSALAVWLKPKGNGNQNGLTVDGEGYDLKNSNTYSISSDSMTVKLYNSKNGGGSGGSGAKGGIPGKPADPIIDPIIDTVTGTVTDTTSSSSSSSSSSGNGNAMGKWYIEINASYATIIAISPSGK